MAMSTNRGDREQHKFVEDLNGRTRVRVETEVKPGGQLDAFGRLRTSTPYTVFDSKQLHSNLPLLFDDQEVSGTGTSSTYSADKASSTLAVTADTAGKRVRQTFQRFNYQPGKSQQIVLTGQFVNQSTDLDGIVSQIGYFDDDNGLFFSYEDGVMNVVTRSKTSGTAVDTKVAQSLWNVDPFNGSGPSGLTLDFTKTQILVIDFQWLGVGSVRFGFDVNGVLFYCHEFENTNISDVVYMSSPNLPIRYSLENKGGGPATSMQHICAAVNSEGGVEEVGVLFHLSNETLEVTATNADTYYALLGIRLGAETTSHLIKLVNASVLMTSAGEFLWRLFFNPTVAGTFTYNAVANAGIDLAVGTSANTVTGGTPFSGGYGSSTGSGGNASGQTAAQLANALRLGSAIDGTLDTIVLAIRSTGGGDTFLGSLTVRELD